METQEKGRICMSCMKSVPEGSPSCPNCGYDGTQQNPEGLLPIGTRLSRGSYIIGRVTRVGTSSIDYAGYHVELMTSCVIREFYPVGVCKREKNGTRVYCPAEDGELFRSGIAAFNAAAARFTENAGDSALPVCYDRFAENGTTYMICEDFEGMTLDELTAKNGGHLTWQQTLTVIRPVLRALETLHGSGLVHGNISPSNILINLNGDVRLRSDMGEKKPGDAYDAPEMSGTADITSAADIYSLGAVLYKCMTGITPASAAARKDWEILNRPADLVQTLPSQVSEAVWMALSLKPAARMQSVQELETFIGTEYFSADPKIPDPAPKKGRLRGALLLSLAAVALALLIWLLLKIVMK